jgi:hypothetical protein
VEENRQRVLEVAQEFVDTFTSPEMVEKMPREIKYVSKEKRNFHTHFLIFN